MGKGTALRTAGALLALLLLGGALGAWAGAAGTAEEPLPKLQVFVSRDPGFGEIAAQLAYTLPFGDPDVEWTPLLTVREDGTRVADIYINPEIEGTRTDDDASGVIDIGKFIGLVKAREPFQLKGKGAFSRGNYCVWMAEAGAIGAPYLPPEPDDDVGEWFIALLPVSGLADGKIDIRDIAAILYQRDGRFYPPEVMLKALGGVISLIPKPELPPPGEPPPPPS